MRTREEYVDEAVRGAEVLAAQLAAGRMRRSLADGEEFAPDDLLDVGRVERARAYAEWRWDAVQADEVKEL